MLLATECNLVDVLSWRDSLTVTRCVKSSTLLSGARALTAYDTCTAIVCKLSCGSAGRVAVVTPAALLLVRVCWLQPLHPEAYTVTVEQLTAHYKQVGMCEPAAWHRQQQERASSSCLAHWARAKHNVIRLTAAQDSK